MSESNSNDGPGEDVEPLNRLRMALNLTQKVNLGNYESADVSIHISGLTIDHSEEDIQQLVEKGKIAYSLMSDRVGRMAREAKQAGGWSGYKPPADK